MKAIDLTVVEEAKDYAKVTPGGYVCGITAVEDVPYSEELRKGDYLKIEYDIAEGELKNYYRDLYKAKAFWGGSFIKSYKESALPFFKGFMTAVENSNSGYKWNNDEKTLLRKFVGLVLAEEEYKGNDGTVKTRLYVAAVHSADKIRKGEFEVPAIKRLNGTSNTSAAATGTLPDGFETVLVDGDLPF